MTLEDTSASDCDCEEHEHMAPYRMWAKRLEEVLSVKEFCALTEFLDSCNDSDFYCAMAEIDQPKHPGLYVDVAAVEAVKKVVNER